MPDDGDSILGMWILWWGASHLSLGYPEILDANTYYPHPGALMYTEPLLGQAVLSWPLFRFLDNRVLATNLATLLTLALAAFGGHLFVSRADRKRRRCRRRGRLLRSGLVQPVSDTALTAHQPAVVATRAFVLAPLFHP